MPPCRRWLGAWGLMASALALALLAGCRPSSRHAGETASVVRVVDGDTIVVRIDGREERVRYIGINAPESVTPDRPVECFGREASAANAALVAGKQVRLERDISDRDRFGRLLRYVYVDGTLVNAELVRQGYARAITIQPDTRESGRLRDLEREAQAAGRGLWSVCSGAGVGDEWPPARGQPALVHP